MTLKDKVTSVAKEQNITVSKIEQDCGIARSSIDKWSRTSPSIDKVKKVADYLSVSVDWLCSDDAETQKTLSLSPMEKELLSLFRQLNIDGQRQALEQLDTLTASKKYNIAAEHNSVSREIA